MFFYLEYIIRNKTFPATRNGLTIFWMKKSVENSSLSVPNFHMCVFKQHYWQILVKNFFLECKDTYFSEMYFLLDSNSKNFISTSLIVICLFISRSMLHINVVWLIHCNKRISIDLETCKSMHILPENTEFWFSLNNLIFTLESAPFWQPFVTSKEPSHLWIGHLFLIYFPHLCYLIVPCRQVTFWPFCKSFLTVVDLLFLCCILRI